MTLDIGKQLHRTLAPNSAASGPFRPTVLSRHWPRRKLILTGHYEVLKECDSDTELGCLVY